MIEILNVQFKSIYLRCLLYAENCLSGRAHIATYICKKSADEKRDKQVYGLNECVKSCEHVYSNLDTALKCTTYIVLIYYKKKLLVGTNDFP